MTALERRLLPDATGSVCSLETVGEIQKLQSMARARCLFGGSIVDRRRSTANCRVAWASC
jgi:hypothetical protein